MAPKEEDGLQGRQQELLLWLNGHNTTPSFIFFTQLPPYSLENLQAALRGAVKKIALTLDPQLECMFSLAKDAEHSIELDESEFIDGRVLAVDELMEMGDRVHSLNRERVVQLLEMCRDEIEWETNEIGRLDVHCDNAAEQKQMRHRESFRYRPLPRKERDVVPGIGVVSEDERRDSTRDDDDVVIKDEETEDDEMLDVDRDNGDWVKKAERDEDYVKEEQMEDVGDND